MGTLFGRILHGPWTLSELAEDVKTMRRGGIRTYTLGYGIEIDPKLLEEGLNRNRRTKRYKIDAYRLIGWFVMVTDIRPRAPRAPMTLLPIRKGKRRKGSRR